MERQLLLLGLLRLQQMHGYQLSEIIDRDLGYLTDLKRPTAYNLLRKMEEEGLVEQHREQPGARPERRVYTVTPAGEATFQRLLSDNLCHSHQSYSASTIGVLFIRELPGKEAARLLRQQVEELEPTMHILSQVLSTHQPESGRYAIELRLAHLRTEHDYLTQLASKLEKEACDAL